MELMEPRRQKVWGWPAVANFILGGTGAGLYLVLVLRKLLLSGALSGPHSSDLEILSPILVCLGFFVLTFEAGRPLRGFYLLGNLRSSWVSSEVLAGVLFICTSVIHWISPSPTFQVAAVCAAFSLIVSHGFIVYRARAITAWNVLPIPLLFLISALTMGGGLLLIMSAFHYMTLEAATLAAVRILVIVDMAAWAIYLLWSRDRSFVKATLFLYRPLSLFFVMGLGRLLPLVALAYLMTAADTYESPGSGSAILALIGLSIIAGSVFQKIGIFFGASFFRGVVMGGAQLINRQEGRVFRNK